MGNTRLTRWFAAPAWAAAMLLLSGCGQEAPSSGYEPGLGAIMAQTQARHAKLWFAATNGNWPLARYELHELDEGFEDAVQYHPTHRGGELLISDLIPQTMDEPMSALRSAVDEQSTEAFTRAFDALTRACNACHRATDFGFNVVTRPVANPFTNQDFSLPKGE